MAIGVGLLGLGTVGAGVASILSSPEGRHPLVRELVLRRVAVRDPARPRPVAMSWSVMLAIIQGSRAHAPASSSSSAAARRQNGANVHAGSHSELTRTRRLASREYYSPDSESEDL